MVPKRLRAGARRLIVAIALRSLAVRRMVGLLQIHATLAGLLPRALLARPALGLVHRSVSGKVLRAALSFIILLAFHSAGGTGLSGLTGLLRAASLT